MPKVRTGSTRRSAGILLYRLGPGGIEVLLAHPGGPIWAKRDEGVWSVPKGEIETGEDPWDVALREFEEETGKRLTAVPFKLATVRQAGGKIVEAFAVEEEFDPADLRSNEFEIEWPPRSGKLERFPEAVEARWMSFNEARKLMLPSQLPLIDALEEKLRG